MHMERNKSLRGFDAGGNDVLLDHLDHAVGLNLNGTDVVVQHHRATSSAFFGSHHVNLREKLDVFIVEKGRNSVNSGIDSGS